MGLGKTLFVFNPEHDLALAVGKGPYTPPAEVISLRKTQSLLPALYAGDSDLILLQEMTLPDSFSSLQYYQQAKDKNLRIITPDKLNNISVLIDKVVPWGWDFHIKKFLLDNGIPFSLLPDDSTLQKIRELSHRRLTIPFRKAVSRQMEVDVKKPVKECFSLEEALEFLAIHKEVFYKAPWSSSGHGIVLSSHIKPKGLQEWILGTIRRQGSVMAEPAWDKSLDFASEWLLDSGKANFLGFSVFEASSRGKYHGNLRLSQTKLLKIIQEKAPEFNDKIILAQQSALESFIAPFYDGPVGIDMLADASGEINSCVEINLRMTMGMIGLQPEK